VLKRNTVDLNKSHVGVGVIFLGIMVFSLVLILPIVLFSLFLSLFERLLFFRFDLLAYLDQFDEPLLIEVIKNHFVLVADHAGQSYLRGMHY
jgi:hypothetical protein